MRNFVMTLALAGVTLTGLATAPALYAQEPKGLDGSMKGGPDMQHMKKMMEMCGNMMQGGMMAAPAAGEAEQVVSLTPAELTWTAGPPMLPPSASMAVIDGSFNRPGPFTVRLKFPANYRIPPHWHPAKATVTVISGTFNMAHGDNLDTTKGKVLPAGSIFEMPATMHHFGWTSEETIIQQQGIGPFAINYLSPADDPRKK